MNISLSAVVLTHNNEHTIDTCLSSLSWCKDIVVLDDFSSDTTLELIKKKYPHVSILQRPLNGDFAQQRNYGLNQSKYEWVLFVDADEVVTKELSKEIVKIIEHGPENLCGLRIFRRDYFLGKWLKYGETGQAAFIRCGKKHHGDWIGTVHEEWDINGTVVTCTHWLTHTPHPSIRDFLYSINHYTDLLSKQWVKQGRMISSWEIVVYPLGKFLHNYILRLGFLDGIAGLIMAIMMSAHSFLVRAKAWLALHPS